MRKLLWASLLILPLLTLGLSGCGDDDGNTDTIGAGGSGATGGTGGAGGDDHGGEGGDGGGGGSECVNTMQTCDECVTPEEDPYLACSPHTAGCVPFDNKGRLPGYPDIPTVP